MRTSAKAAAAKDALAPTGLVDDIMSIDNSFACQRMRKWWVDDLPKTN